MNHNKKHNNLDFFQGFMFFENSYKTQKRVWYSFADQILFLQRADCLKDLSSDFDVRRLATQQVYFLTLMLYNCNIEAGCLSILSLSQCHTFVLVTFQVSPSLF